METQSHLAIFGKLETEVLCCDGLFLRGCLLSPEDWGYLAQRGCGVDSSVSLLPVRWGELALRSSGGDVPRSARTRQATLVAFQSRCEGWRWFKELVGPQALAAPLAIFFVTYRKHTLVVEPNGSESCRLPSLVGARLSVLC